MREDYHPANSNRIYTEDEFELLKKIEEWKARTGRMWPTNCEVLAIMKDELGYRKVAEPKPIERDTR